MPQTNSAGSGLKTEKSVLIGVIADTHGLLRPEAVAALRDSDRIIHAGDVGTSEILDQLEDIAPVTAVRGNIDRKSWATSLPESAILELGGVSIYILHDLFKLDLKPEAAGFQVVVSGHSHIGKFNTINGVLYFNPGGAGPKRFKLPSTIGRLTISSGIVQPEIVTIVE